MNENSKHSADMQVAKPRRCITRFDRQIEAMHMRLESLKRRADSSPEQAEWIIAAAEELSAGLEELCRKNDEVTKVFQAIEAERCISEERYRRLLASATDYVYTVEIKDGRPVATSHGPGCEAVTGYAPEEYAAEPYLWHRMVYEEDKASVTKQAGRVLSGEGGLPLDHRIIHKDGSIRWVRNTPVPRYDDHGRLVAYDGLITDITERKQAEETLRESEEKYRALFEASIGAIFVETLDGRVLDCNASACKMYGYAKEELIGLTVADLVPEEITPALADIVSRELATGSVFIEASNKKKNGEIFPCEVSTRLITIGGEPQVIVYVRDITERKLVEEARFREMEAEARARIAMAAKTELENQVAERRRAEQALQDLLRKYYELEFIVNKSPAIAFLWRASEGWPVILVSDNIAQFGYVPQDLTSGKISYASLIHPDDLERVASEVAQYTQQGRAEFTQEYRIYTGAGEIRWLDDRTWVRRDTRGQVTHYQGIVIDITGRKRAEEALKRRNEELAARNAIATTIGQSLNLNHILNATLDAVLEVMGVDAGWMQLLTEGKEGGVLLMIAQRGFSLEMVQETRTIKLGEGITGQVAQSGRPIVVAKASDDPRLYTLVGQREELHTLAAVPLKSKDQVLGVMGVFNRDPRELSAQAVELLVAIGHQIGVAIENAQLAEKAAEIELLREVDRLRSELIANISHELRTPLGLIKVCCTTLLREDVAFCRDTQQELLGNIKDEADKLEELVDNLLDLSRMQNGRLRLNKCPADVGQLVRKVIKAMEVQLGPHRFVYDFPADPLMATIDSRCIEQVLRNLVSNAIKYSPEGGDITIRGRREGRQFIIQVKDQGIGISQEDYERIFERFYRVDNEIVQGIRGAGLGLPVCQGIVEAHGGRIWVESLPCSGSAFYFTLPSGGEEESDPDQQQP
jgi:PAS domain S-box-containing protein